MANGAPVAVTSTAPQKHFPVCLFDPDIVSILVLVLLA
jgi:hypothetical protein